MSIWPISTTIWVRTQTRPMVPLSCGDGSGSIMVGSSRKIQFILRYDTIIAPIKHKPSEAVPRIEASYRSVVATRFPTNLRSVPVAENSTHL